MIIRRKTRVVKVGGVMIGGDAPITVQTMTSVPITDIDATLQQIHAVADLGAAMIRCAVPTLNDIAALATVIIRSPLPVIADIHFDWRIALSALKVGAAKIRLNPGNIADWDGLKQVLHLARERQIPLRLGVNGGSIKYKNPDDQRSIADALIEECLFYVDRFANENFHDIVLSLKTSSVADTIFVNREIAKKCDYPLHLGVTEAGVAQDAMVKSAVALGALLSDGIGDTIRVSFTDTPASEVLAGKQILRAVGILRDIPELISCPTCGRCRAKNLPEVAKLVRNRLSMLNQPLKIAVMGCEVNGPGEAQNADYGLAACAEGFWLFAKGEKIKLLSAETAIDELFLAING